MAEWLRRGTANPLGSARVSSNLIVIDFVFLIFEKARVARHAVARRWPRHKGYSCELEVVDRVCVVNSVVVTNDVRESECYSKHQHCHKCLVQITHHKSCVSVRNRSIIGSPHHPSLFSTNQI